MYGMSSETKVALGSTFSVFLTLYSQNSGVNEFSFVQVYYYLWGVIPQVPPDISQIYHFKYNRTLKPNGIAYRLKKILVQKNPILLYVETCLW